MTDYMKLIEALREYSGCRKGEIARITSDAADAIEELSKTVKDLTTKVECSPMQISGKAFDRAIEAWNEKARKAVQEEA